MLTRIISAIVMAALVAAAVLWAPEIVFNALILLIITAGLYEFFKLTLPPVSVYREVAWIFGVVLAAEFLFLGDKSPLAATLVIGLFAVTLVYMRCATTSEGVTAMIGVTLLGVVYLCATLPFFGFLRELPHGKALVFMAISAAAMSDTFALFAGKVFGRHKFAPLTSPNKTMEGFLAGLLGSVLSVFAVKVIAWHDLPSVHAVSIGLLIGFVGPMGDLIESLFKRDYHVKDSGSIIPGHGGFLDRLDAMIFAGPALYFYVKVFII